MYKLNLFALISILLGCAILRTLIEMVGEMPECSADPHKWWEMLLTGAFLVVVFILGRFSKYEKE